MPIKKFIGSLLFGFGPCVVLSVMAFVQFEVYKGPSAKSFAMGAALSGLSGALGLGFFLNTLGVLPSTRKRSRRKTDDGSGNRKTGQGQK